MLIAAFLMGLASGVLGSALYALWPDLAGRWRHLDPPPAPPSPEYEASMARVQRITREGFTLGDPPSPVPDYGHEAV